MKSIAEFNESDIFIMESVNGPVLIKSGGELIEQSAEERESLSQMITETVPQISENEINTLSVMLRHSVKGGLMQVEEKDFVNKETTVTDCIQVDDAIREISHYRIGKTDAMDVLQRPIEVIEHNGGLALQNGVGQVIEQNPEQQENLREALRQMENMKKTPISLSSAPKIIPEVRFKPQTEQRKGVLRIKNNLRKPKADKSKIYPVAVKVDRKGGFYVKFSNGQVASYPRPGFMMDQIGVPPEHQEGLLAMILEYPTEWIKFSTGEEK